MNLFEKLLYFLQGEMIEPTAFGWFHILWLVLVITAIFILYKRKKFYNERQLKIVLGVYGIIALILELLKQLIWAFNYDPITNIITWDYEWYAFPFQLCSTPIFISLLCLIIKNKEMKTYLYSYLSFITILGSIATMLYPASCFVDDLLVNIHTMWLHGGSFVVSVVLILNQEVEITKENLKKGLFVFLIFVCIANLLNVILVHSSLLQGETFNMFYISPYFDCTLPIFNIIYENSPYLLFLGCYLLTIFLGSILVYSFFRRVYEKNS